MKNSVLPLVILVVFFCSCSKENNSVTPIPAIVDDSTLISQIVQFDTTLAAPMDSSRNRYYYYDAQKRLVKYYSYSYINGVRNTNQYLELLYSYNGSDTIPFKKVINAYSAAGVSMPLPNTTVTFYYYSNAVLQSDSTVSFQFGNGGKYINKYYYSPGKIVDSSFEENTGNYVKRIGRKVVYQQLSNGNIVSQKDTTVTTGYFPGSFPPPPYVSTTISSHIFSYDSKTNPLHRFAKVGNVPFYELNILPQIYSLEPNNLLESVEEVPGISNRSYRYTYEYKPNGYPKIARIIDALDPTKFSKVKFIYTN